MVRGQIRAAAIIVVTVALTMGVIPGSAPAQTKINVPSTFPVKISKSGSYILVANLVANSKNPNVINVTVPNVLINLNGFRVGGPSLAGTASGINAAGQANVTIENGSVSGMGSDGILLGNNGVVRNIQANGNGGNGINCQGTGCLVTGCTANSNGASGLNFVDGTSGYNENVMSGNTTAAVTNGTNLGSNVCNSSLCP